MKKQWCLTLIILLFCCTSEAAIVIGNPKGSITLTEVYDYQCGYCRASEVSVEQLINQQDGLRVRLLPVAIINSQSVVQAAYAMSRALYHHDFNEVHHDFMFENFSDMTSIHDYIECRGMSASIMREMQSKKVKAEILEGETLMKSLHQHETPLFILQSASGTKSPVVMVGQQNAQTLSMAIESLQENTSDAR